MTVKEEKECWFWKILMCNGCLFVYCLCFVFCDMNLIKVNDRWISSFYWFCFILNFYQMWMKQDRKKNTEETPFCDYHTNFLLFISSRISLFESQEKHNNRQSESNKNNINYYKINKLDSYFSLFRLSFLFHLLKK